LTSVDDSDFVNFGAGRTVVSMSVMRASVCAIMDSQQVKCFGQNNYGQLGYGDTLDRGYSTSTMGTGLPAVDFGTNRNAVRLFPSSSDTMCALLNTAEVKCWGHNGHLGLGMGIPITQNIGDEASEMGDNLVAIAIPTGRTVINLWVAHHVVAILDDNTMIAWGGTHI
jgi:E3 ubiquitin-protein ligase HERC3